MNGFEMALRSAGLLPRRIDADGKIKRCGTVDKPHSDNGWYVLHPDGHGVWGDWACGSSEVLGTYRDENTRIDPVRLAQLERQRAARLEAERAERRRAIQTVRERWTQARTMAQLHPYLVDKGLSALGCEGLKLGGRALLVPMTWHGERGTSLVNYQRIQPDGEKRFFPSAPVSGTCFVIERPRAAITAFVEGLATGLAVYQSVRAARVVVCFNAGNILPAIEQLRRAGQLTGGSMVVAGDNDYGTEARRGFNPGQQAAERAAAALGCGAVWPVDIEGTDYADALKEYGEGGHRRIERQIQAAARLVMT